MNFSVKLFMKWKTLQEMEELKKIYKEAERSHQLRIDQLFRQDRQNQLTVNQLTVQIQELQDRVNSMNDQESFKITKRQTVLNYPAFTIILYLIRVLVKYFVALLDYDLIHGTYTVNRQTLLKIHLRQLKRQYLFFYKCVCKKSHFLLRNRDFELIESCNEKS